MDYTNGYFFLSVRGELRPIFNEALDKANIGIGHEYKNLFYYLPKEEALKFNTKYVYHIQMLTFHINISEKNNCAILFFYSKARRCRSTIN